MSNIITSVIPSVEGDRSSKREGSVDQPLGDEVVNPLLVLHVGDEDDLGVAAAHLLQRLQIADLHGGLAVEFLGSQTHQLGRLHIRPRRYDFAFGEPALLGGRRKRVLQILAQLDVLYENLLDLNPTTLTSTPHSSMYWSTCFSMSSAISCRFSSRSCSMNCPQVFLRMA